MVSTESTHLQDLQFNVAGLLKGQVGETRSYDFRIPVSQLDQIDESFDVTGPFIGAVRFLKTTETVFTKLKGELDVHLDCARCLNPFDAKIEVESEEEFRPTIDISSGRAMHETSDDEALVIDEQHILDLTEILRQAIILALPVTPLCQDDCAGICPICGVDNNEEQCSCEDTDIDPRWEALSALSKVEEDNT